MTILTANIDNDKDLPVLPEILTRFGLNFKVDKRSALNKDGEKLLKKLKSSLLEINDWEAGKIKLQDAKTALAEIEAELENGL